MLDIDPRPDSLISFTKAERVGILTILVVTFLLSSSNYWLPLLLDTPDSLDETLAVHQEEVEQWLAEMRIADSLQAAAKRQKKPRSFSKRKGRSTQGASRPAAAPERQALPELYSLNLESVNGRQLASLGLSDRLIAQWLSYRKKGGQFAGVDGLSRLYAMEDSTLQRIKPYFNNPPEQANQADTAAKAYAEPLPVAEPIVVELNTASKADLVSVRGIGNYYATKILDYRASLGGFTSLEQLDEIRAFRPGAVEGFRDQLMVNAEVLRLLYINEVTADQLGKHPYVDRAVAKTVIAYRKNHGKFATEGDLLATVVVDETLLGRLRPYLDYR